MTETEGLMARADRSLANTYARFPVVLERGEGCRVWDVEGKEYLDFVAGIAVCVLGHCHPALVPVVQAQAAKLLHVSNLYYIEPQIRLAELLCQHAFADRVFFCNSGAEANEAAIKLARKHAKEHGGPERVEIITMENGFHGRTVATVTATAQPKYQMGFEPLLPGFRYVPFDDLAAVEQAVSLRTAAILVEPIQGEGGIRVPSEGYLQGLRKLCDQTGALLIFDEVQTGIGRTGRLFAYEHWGAEPDIMTLAKALGGGLPIGAMMAKEQVAASFTPGTHAATFGGNPLVTSAALATLTTVLKEDLILRAAKMGDRLLHKLRAIQTVHRAVRAVRGKGLLIGMELDQEVRPILTRCLDHGLLLSSAGEKVIRFAPPLIVSEAEVKQAVDVLDTVLREVTG
ncbi:MAG: acetylornithine transaminase [candidate division NC10 bacterium]|nr:acetylornithine transaminase [candidate division NC10 bacterium]MCH7895892.1 acetylornithine transaminase [candidate division NC10 bacterium]MCZ6551343.1 acetylornithine transaminase [candidate division NC10 bacterium]